MKRYVSCATNLKVIMNMMRDNKCKHYVIELFHIFKVNSAQLCEKQNTLNHYQASTTMFSSFSPSLAVRG